MKNLIHTRKMILFFAVLIAAVLVVILIISSHRKKEDVTSAQVEQTVQKLKQAEEQSVGEVRVQISEASGAKSGGKADSDGKAGEGDSDGKAGEGDPDGKTGEGDSDGKAGEMYSDEGSGTRDGNGDSGEGYDDATDDSGDASDGSGDDSSGPGSDSGNDSSSSGGVSGDDSSGSGDDSGDNGSGTGSSDSNYTALYADSVIMGDSVAHDIEAYGFLDSLHVIAENGVSLEELTNEIDTAVSLAPRNIFLYYGFNDIGHIGDDYERYKQGYRDVLARLKAALPDAAIYVNALFPVHDLDTLQNGYYNDIDTYNELISQVCEEFGVAFLDNRDLVRDEYYYEDGYHFTYDFYPLWLDAMAQEAGLSA